MVMPGDLRGIDVRHLVAWHWVDTGQRLHLVATVPDDAGRQVWIDHDAGGRVWARCGTSPSATAGRWPSTSSAPVCGLCWRILAKELSP